MIKLLPGLKPYTLSLFLVIIFLLAQSLAELYLPTLMSDLVDNGMMKGDSSYVWRFGSYMLLVALLSSLCSVAASYLSSIIGMGYGRDTRNRVFFQVENYSLHEFDQIGTASLINRTTNDITQVQTLLVIGLRFMVSSHYVHRGIIMAYSKDKHLTLILVVVLPLMLAFIAILARYVVPLFRAMQSKLDKVNLVLRENLTGIRVIRAFNRLKRKLYALIKPIGI